MQKVDPLIKQIAQLLDARLQTFEVNIKGEIKASEERMTKKLQNVEDKLDGKLTDHEKRITRLEKHKDVSTTN
jgi:hypothetical protein